VINQLLEMTDGYHRTCSAKFVYRAHTTFARNKTWLYMIASSNVDCCVFVPKDLDFHVSDRTKLIPVDDVDKWFILFHNEVNRFRSRSEDCIINPSYISDEASIGTPGVRFTYDENGSLVLMKHMGNVIIEKNCFVSDHSVIHAATLDSTILKEGVKVGTNCTIGHNSIIRNNTIIVDGSNIGGSCEIGSSCFIGIGTKTRDNIKICNNVMTGAGTVVVKDIEEPGIYAGVPARRLKDWDGKW
jgi:acetyltransferase-like isoleucine patch superfamily enzyme